MTERFFLYGAKEQGRVVLDILELLPNRRVEAFIDDAASPANATFRGIPVVSRAEALRRISRLREARVIVTIGENAVRCRIAEELARQGIVLGTAIHPRAVVARDAIIGSGTVVMAGAVINPGVTVGKNVIINTGATVDHDSSLGDGVHLSPGVNLAGTVQVGPFAHLGTGACVIPGVKIGRAAVVGAGAVVIRDVPPDRTVVGNPAKPIAAARRQPA